MKKVLFLVLGVLSLNVFADYTCENNQGQTIKIKENQKKMILSGPYAGVVKNISISLDEFIGTSSSPANFKTVSVNVFDGDVIIFDLEARKITFSVTCE